MKFCKNLQKIVDISDPSWAPYWPNYKMLKKFIKELPSLVPTEEENAEKLGSQNHNTDLTSKVVPPDSRKASPVTTGKAYEQTSQQPSESATQETNSSKRNNKTKRTSPITPNKSPQHTNTASHNVNVMAAIKRSPGEKTFFRLLHEELRKAQRFFNQAQQEFQIREERLHEGMSIMKQHTFCFHKDKWSCLAKSVFNLYKDLLLLETFAIMAYCSFSKILKKHDKVTGYETRRAFMAKVVNKANFTTYPVVFDMIGRTESLYEEVSKNLIKHNNNAIDKDGHLIVGEDERLFINMIHRLNSQILDKAEAEGSPTITSKRKEARNMLPSSLSGGTLDLTKSNNTTECKVTVSLRALVEENDALSKASSNCLSDDQDENNADNEPNVPNKSSVTTITTKSEDPTLSSSSSTSSPIKPKNYPENQQHKKRNIQMKNICTSTTSQNSEKFKRTKTS